MANRGWSAVAMVGLVVGVAGPGRAALIVERPTDAGTFMDVKLASGFGNLAFSGLLPGASSLVVANGRSSSGGVTTTLVESAGLEFAIPTLPAGARFDHAILTVYALGTDGQDIQVSGRADADGRLKASEFGPTGSTPIGDFTAAAGRAEAVDVTGFLRSAKTPYVGFQLAQSSIRPGSSASSFSGRLAGRFAPTLTFDIAPAVAAPEPSTIIPAGLAGLVGLAYAWRRQNARLAA